MSYKLLCTLLAPFVLISCKLGEKEKETTSVPAEKKAENTSAINCYEYINKADTVILKLIHVGDAITGLLVYNLDGKDINKGTIQGGMHGNILVANYTFMSEGTTSERQVAFKLDNGRFIEGHGESYTDQDKVRFKNIGSLQFDSPIKLAEVACK
jgi:hypothetical protein